MRRPDPLRVALFGFVVPLLVAAPRAAHSQDWRGVGRVEGFVNDEAGQPIAGASVAASCPGRGGTTVKADKKGHFVLGGVVGCNWELDVSADGYETLRISVNLPSEQARLAPVRIPLKKHEEDPAVALQALAAQADTAYKAGRYAEARAEYEKLLAQRPDLAATIHQQIGFTYVQEKQYDKAVAELEKVLATDPGNASIRAIAAQAALEGRNVDKGRELLAGLDETKIESPDIFFNMGINFFNAGETQDAIGYFDKTIAKDPAYVDAYYRRALAQLGLGHTAEAKADFQKVIELAPDGEMATMSRKALGQLP